ncbi:hypothetical protein RHSIM_RhsimUnG0156700 [Rhododendron simsii]|uniref:GOLD domain-containing protein n=1 Tax=Rhododendron simsii TaxID=118357 RepID=A0A834FVH9_RHOSS|nr:hypothetical protein RHSIM_RhsimUnG0156700 [Rhododendron simsii]
MIELEKQFVELAAVLLLAVLSSLQQEVSGIRFVIDREECFSHNVEYASDTVHFAFVVIKSEGAWHYSPDGVDLVVKALLFVKGPSGDQIHDFRDKTSEKSQFVAQKNGLHQHLKPLLEQIARIEEALYNIQFEQHWLEAQTDQQAIVNEGMSRRAIHKVLYQSAALTGAGVLQVYLLRRLFERKLGMSRV